MWFLEFSYGENCKSNFNFENFEECYWWFRNSVMEYKDLKEAKMWHKEDKGSE